jgi:hypothetical protein
MKYYDANGIPIGPYATPLKKGDAAIHASRGPCQLISDIGGGPNKGTLVKLESGEELEASTVYLKPRENGPAGTNPGT